jgi:hypothetical protein
MPWREAPLPRYVEDELRGYLKCGVFAYSFVRAHCDACCQVGPVAAVGDSAAFKAEVLLRWRASSERPPSRDTAGGPRSTDFGNPKRRSEARPAIQPKAKQTCLGHSRVWLPPGAGVLPTSRTLVHAIPSPSRKYTTQPPPADGRDHHRFVGVERGHVFRTVPTRPQSLTEEFSKLRLWLEFLVLRCASFGRVRAVASVIRSSTGSLTS